MKMLRRMSLLRGGLIPPPPAFKETDDSGEEGDIVDQVAKQTTTCAAESVLLIPPVHTFFYKAWVVCWSLCILAFIPVSLATFAIIRTSLHATSYDPATTDPDSLMSQGQDKCEDQFPVLKMSMGTPRTMFSQVFCLYNASVHSRPYVARFPIGLTPGALCHHLLYYSLGVTPKNELETKNPEFDYECRGLESVATLKKRFAAMKVYFVLSAETRVENAFLLSIAGAPDAIDRLVASVKQWAGRYGFDGVFVHWLNPLVWSQAKPFFGNLSRQLRPNYTFGVILPRERRYLKNYNVMELFPMVDWMIATTHGFSSPEKSNVTSCYSPFTNGKKNTMRGQIIFLDNALGKSIDLAKFCFTVSARSVGYTVTGTGSEYRMKASGPGNLTRYTGIPGVLAYSQVCRLGRRAKGVEKKYCAYMRVENTWLGIENHWSIRLKINKTLALLKALKTTVLSTQPFCMAIWDMELDDHKKTCARKAFPILESAVAALP